MQIPKYVVCACFFIFYFFKIIFILLQAQPDIKISSEQLAWSL